MAARRRLAWQGLRGNKPKSGNKSKKSMRRI
jgi:hypothetical protein